MKTDTVRVAHLIGDMSGGGVEAVVMNYYRHIDRTKIQFDFIIHDTSTHVPKEEIEAMGGRIYYVPHYKRLSAYKKALFKIFTDNKYDIVHSHMNTLSVFSLQVAKKAGVKVRIAHSHSTSNKKEWKRNIIKNILRPFSKKYATHYFACSELAGRWLFGDKAYDSGKVKIINNAIDIDKFRFDDEARRTVRTELGLSDKFVIGHIGRFMAQKNHEFLVDVFYEVQKKRDDAVLLLLGDGPLYGQIENKVKSLGVSHKVIFLGVSPSPERYYNAMDCFVFPSLYEGLGMVCIEAQINGLPCIVSTEVPKSVKLLDNFSFFSLDNRAEWINLLCDKNLSIRNFNFDYDLFKNYDITCEQECLTTAYNEMLMQENK